MKRWRIPNLWMIGIMQPTLPTNHPTVRTNKLIHRYGGYRNQGGHLACHALIAAPPNFCL